MDTLSTIVRHTLGWSWEMDRNNRGRYRTMVAALDAGDARGHLALADDGVWAVVGDRGPERGV